ncbi:MAG: carboxyltransferase domain-containing protein [Actinomycetota bacterium]|nr:carboxyltransferase domain-containing protein [Actinomycetota bacterium]
MRPTVDPVIERSPASEGKPSITIRQAGDRALLVEFGEMEFDLTLNFFVLAFDAAVREHPADGLIETAPGFRTILVSYDSVQLPTEDLVHHLHAIYDDLPVGREMAIASRLIKLPIAFDDSESRRAVGRYIHSIRADAPNCDGGDNIEYILRYNGLADREELYEHVLATEHWTGFIGFFPGLPFMFPIDSRHVLVAPKYNPTRTWTAEGAVGLGGPCLAIYPVESPGGYQLFGRSLPVYDLQARNARFREDPLLLRPSDRVRFHRVEEAELMQFFEDVHADRYTYEIAEESFDVGGYLDEREQHSEEADRHRRQLDEASAATPVP